MCHVQHPCSCHEAATTRLPPTNASWCAVAEHAAPVYLLSSHIHAYILATSVGLELSYVISLFSQLAAVLSMFALPLLLSAAAPMEPMSVVME